MKGKVIYWEYSTDGRFCFEKYFFFDSMASWNKKNQVFWLQLHEWSRGSFLKVRNYTLFWLFYNGDIFFIQTYKEEKLIQFVNELSNCHLNLKFKYETSSCTVNFPDLNLNLRNGLMCTTLFIKPTDYHQYLNCRSSPPTH